MRRTTTIKKILKRPVYVEYMDVDKTEQSFHGWFIEFIIVAKEIVYIVETYQGYVQYFHLSNEKYSLQFMDTLKQFEKEQEDMP